VATLALLGLTAIVVLVAIFTEPRSPNPSPTPTGTNTISPSESETSPSPTDSESPTPTDSPSQELVTLTEADVLGLSITEATTKLVGLGLEVRAVPGETIDGNDARVRSVYSVSPVGDLPLGSVVELLYYIGTFTEPTETPTVTPTPTDTSEPTPTPTETVP
jgi:eukaryotic-like serine/threonine-protein kinase